MVYTQPAPHHDLFAAIFEFDRSLMDTFLPIAASRDPMDRRGVEPIEWHPSTDFTVTSGGGTVFDDVDLSEGEWTEYCEKSAAPVSIMEIEHTFEPA